MRDNINVKLEVNIDKLNELQKLVNEANELTSQLTAKLQEIHMHQCKVKVELKQDAK